MARSSRRLPPGIHDFFITSRCHNKEWFDVPLENVWQIMSRYLHFIHHAHSVQIRAFVLMANHFHMIVTADSDNLPLAMNYLMRECAREINRVSGTINQVWGRPYHSARIATFIHYQNAYKYLYRNPVEAGACKLVEEYPYSGLRSQLGLQHSLIPIVDELIFEDLEANLRWLNTAPAEKDYRKLVRQALAWRTMSFGKTKDRLDHPFNHTRI